MLKKIAAFLMFAGIALPMTAHAFLDKDKQAAVSNYADQMISLMQQPAIGFATDRTLLLKRYLDENDPAYKKTVALYRDADALLSAMENYSVAVSTLSTTGASEAEVIGLLADQLERFYALLPADIEVAGADFGTRIQSIRQQDKYLDALQVAQPVITGIGRYGQDLMAEYEQLIGELTISLSNRISGEYEELVDFKAVIDDRRIKFLSRVDTEKPNVAKTEEAAIQQLNQLSRIMAVMQPYLQHFWDTQSELNSVTNDIYLNTAKLKLMFLVWVRAHAQLASGEADGEAFDVMEYKDLLEEAAKFGKDLSNQ